MIIKFCDLSQDGAHLTRGINRATLHRIRSRGQNAQDLLDEDLLDDTISHTPTRIHLMGMWIYGTISVDAIIKREFPNRNVGQS
jgi:hypothetical protein